MMRIALAHSHARTFGGGERAVLELARGLTARGHEVRLLLGGFDPRATYADLASLPVQPIGRAQWALAAVAADVMVTNSFGANLLALRNGSRVAYWVHSARSRFLVAPNRRPDLLARRAIDFLAVRRAARLVANSRYAATRLRALYGREPDAIVYPGVDLSTFAPADAVGRPEYAISVGRIAPEKGLDRLFEAWRDLPDVPLHVVGDGAPDAVRAVRAQAPRGVVFHGSLSGAALADAYRGATVAVFAPYEEEFGLAPLEAMACGVPVVAWREGGLLETVVDGQTGYLVDDPVTLRQRVRLLVRDAALRRQLAVAARARALNFGWERTITSMEALLLDLAGLPTPARSW
jgi:glycosyltransferase involved in cell wall biosynthesis